MKVKPLLITALLGFGFQSACTSDDDDNTVVADQQLEATEGYSELVCQNYLEALSTGEALKTAVDAFVETPSAETLEAAKQAWLTSRLPYGQTEAFRFYDGPIDNAEGPEGQLNAWPMDEAYLDYVDGNPTAGIINNTAIELSKSRIAGLNEGGEDDILGVGENFDAEKAIASGYHTIEFLLWGTRS